MGGNNTRQGYAKAPQTVGLLFGYAKPYPASKDSGMDGYGNVFFAFLRPSKNGWQLNAYSNVKNRF